MAKIVGAKANIEGVVKYYSLQKLQDIYINSKAEWETIEDKLECPNCGLKLIVAHKEVRGRDYLKRLPNTDHQESCPYFEERASGISRGNTGMLEVGLSTSDVRKKARYAIQKLLNPQSQDNDKKNSSNKQSNNSIANKKDESSTKQAVVPNVNLSKEYNENDIRARRTPPYRTKMGGDVTEKDLGKIRNFAGIITRLDFFESDSAFPIIAHTEWKDRVGCMVFSQDMFVNDSNLLSLFKYLKKYIDETHGVIFSAVVEVIYNKEDIVGVVGKYDHIFFSDNVLLLAEYLFSQDIIDAN